MEKKVFAALKMTKLKGNGKEGLRCAQDDKA
jgi:hypothetical protein